MSMIGQRMIYKIDQRLKKGSSAPHEHFGSFKIYSVEDSTLHCTSPKKNDAFFRMILTESFKQHFLLNSCRRQVGSDQVLFTSFLDAISINTVSK